MTSTMGCRTASPSSSTNRMMVVTVAGAFHRGQRAIAIPYSRLAQTLQTMRRMGCQIVGVSEAQTADSVEDTPVVTTSNVTPMQPTAARADTPQADTAQAAPEKPTRSRRRRTSAKTQSSSTRSQSTAKSKPKRTPRSKRKRATG
ncbi:MAG: hypothetical protein AAFX40_05730 [Cyanobacteria bacterium J06639_1]